MMRAGRGTGSRLMAAMIRVAIGMLVVTLSGCGGSGSGGAVAAAGVAASQPSNTSAPLPGPSVSAVELSWQPPTENEDGSALTDLQGYEVHYGNATQAYSQTIRLANPGLTNYVVQNLPAGTYYFAVTAYNSAGVGSSLSPEVSATVD